MEQLKSMLLELRPEIDFDSCVTLIDDGILDSFDIISLVGDINETFDVEITAADLIPENFNSMQAIYKLIQSLE